MKVWVGDLGDGVYDGFVNDFRIGIICVKMVIVYYVILYKNIVGRLIEVVKGVVIGDMVVVNKLCEISEEEVFKFRLIY